MKNLLTFILFLFCVSSSAQKISGFYSGTLYNDSTRMTQKYELALNEYRGKITGYSYVTFVSQDTFYWGIRKVKATVEGDSLVVVDDKIVANNFPEAPAKKVGRTITIPLHGQDSLVMINGSWKTNQTKKYYSVPGSIRMDRSSDSSSSPLISHLKELKIIHDPVYAAIDTRHLEKQDAETRVVKEKKSKTKTEETKQNDNAIVQTKVKVKEDKVKVEKETREKTKSNPINNKPVVLPFNERKEKHLQNIEVTSDSLVLAFYDNGMVDGDTISVYVNNEIVISGARLKSVATKKTIGIPANTDIVILLVADNLGTLPPNTGLMTVTDGDRSYQVNFSADMQTNASVTIRRKKIQ